MSDCPIASAVQRLSEDLAMTIPVEGWPRGLIGAFSAEGRPLYAYPEVAGHWLAWASTEPHVADRTGLDVVERLEAMSPGGPWPTRVATGRKMLPDRYRNHVFLFDHCMLWSGLRRWSQIRGCMRASALARRTWQVMELFVDDHRLLPCWPAPDSERAPHWSTHGGPFLIKACVRLLHGNGAAGRVWARRAESLADAAVQRPHAYAHPQLYAIEGLFEGSWQALARQAFTALLNVHGGPASIREQPGVGPRRADVLAQLLRAGCLLQQIDRRDPAWIALAHELAARVDGQGRIPFAEAADPRPTWTSLFALQALQCWLEQPHALTHMI